MAGLSNVCPVEDRVGAVPLAVLHLVNQSINTVLMVAELPNVRSVDDQVSAVPLAVLQLANQ